MAAATNPAAIPTISEKQLPADAGAGTDESPVERWRSLWWLPCELALQIPVKRFTVGDLLRLGAGNLISTGWSRSTEVSLYANGQRIGSGEFEAVDDHIAARIMELV